MTARTQWILNNDAPEPRGRGNSSTFFSCGLLLVALALFSSGCARESAPTPAEMLVGRWNIATKEAFGRVLPGDGSYLEFQACDEGECSGADHMGSNATTGSFAYQLAADGKNITITDATVDGGMFKGTWTIFKLDATQLRIGIHADNLGEVMINLEKVQ